MATTPLTLMESTTATAAVAAVATSPTPSPSPTAAQVEAAAIGAAAAATRPTRLFAAGSVDSLTTTTSATANSATAAAATSPGGSSSSSAATSPSFLPEMPQWKKDLIQRRKSNVARTIGAGALTPTTPTTSTTAAAATASPAATATPIAQQQQQQPERSTLSDHQQLQQPEQPPQPLYEHDQHAADGLHTLSNDFALHSTTVYQKQITAPTPTTATTILSTKASRHSASQQQQLQQQQHQQQQPPRGEQKSAAALTAEQQNAKSNLAKMPATHTTASAPLRSPTKQKAENVLGGHYTPPAGNEYELARTERDRKDWSQQQQQASSPTLLPSLPSPTKLSAVPIPKQRSLYLTAAKTNQTKEQQQQQQQQQREVACTSPVAATTSSASSATTDTNSNGNTNTITSSNGNGLFYASEKRIGGNAATTRLASSSTVREMVGVGGGADSGVTVEAALEVQETETTRKANMSGKSGTYAAAQRSQMQSTATISSVPTTPTGASTPLTHQPQPQPQPQPHQFHSKYESERTLSGTSAHTHVERLQVSSTSTLLEPAGAETDSCSTLAPSASNAFNSSGKIFSKLQNNQFIKQELSGPSCNQSQVSARYHKYKTYSPQESTACTNFPASVAGSGLVSSSGAGSPTKTTSSTAPTACAIKKKMVAVQEMKKTTQNTNHHHHHNHHHHGLHQQQHIIDAATCARESRPRPPSQSLSQTEADRVEFDPGEDLSYGPGIVSKLRCRYLSLAYRESMEKERLCLDNMRRTTSLNNLLDRDDRKDELDDDDVDPDEEVEGDEENGHVELHADGERNRQLKPAVGILKHSNDAGQQDGVAYAAKKTATFQKHGSRSAVVTTNGTRMSQSEQGVGMGAASLMAAGDKLTESPRSRRLMRGNDSLKRARSVEALLCERSLWNYALSRSSYGPCKTQALIPTCVTIEDKINNARGRLILGTDVMPPKRLSSVIDDTERPPPDLVKQTLKKFEATANRRGRGPHRANGTGEVANKVANYKTIIMENKPPIVFPKPPLSPTKKLISPHVKPAVKPVVGAADLLGSPLGRKTTGAAAAASATNSSGSVTAKVQTSNVAAVAGVVIGGLSEHSPDIIPRYKLLGEKSESSPAVVDSPVTALTKKLGKLRIDADKQSTGSVSGGGGVVDSSGSSGVVANVMTKESQTKQQLSKLPAESTNRGSEVAGSDMFTGGALDGDGECDASGGDAAIVSVDNDNKKKHNDRASAGVAKSSDVGAGGVGVGVSVELDTVQAGTGAISSDLSDDESGPLGATKRVTKTALDNIARAGTTQQFKFAGQSTKTSHISNGSEAQQLQQQQPQHRTPHPQQHTNPDIPTSVLNASPGKQIGVIRPLLTTASSAQANTPTTPNSGSISNKQQQQQQHMETLKQHSTYTHHTPQSAHSVFHANSANSAAAATNSPHTPPPLTSREIEKNRINEMKKTALTDTKATATAAATATANNGNCTAAAAATTSLNTVINTNAPGFKASATAAACSPLSGTAAANASGVNELDAGAANNSPLWALRKKRSSPPTAAAENTTMVFNFSNRKEVPDYIENDGVIFRRKRELPKPNESGFVLLGDLSVETSTDTDYDDFSMCPPSPCDVEFENANIVIDGKSSIRQKSKDATFRVQFNDTLTSTFEYPSEASLVIEDSFSEHYDDLLSAYENLRLDDIADSPALHHHHHVAVDEIIQLPTPPNASSPATSSATNTPTKNILGNLPLDYPILAKGIMSQQLQQQQQQQQLPLEQEQQQSNQQLKVPQSEEQQQPRLQLQQQLQPKEPPHRSEQRPALCESSEKRAVSPLPAMPPQRPKDLPLPMSMSAAATAATAKANDGRPQLQPKRLKATLRNDSATDVCVLQSAACASVANLQQKQQQPQREQQTGEKCQQEAAAATKLDSKLHQGRKKTLQQQQQQQQLESSTTTNMPLLNNYQPRPRVLHGFKLASYKNTATTTTTTTTTTTDTILYTSSAANRFERNGTATAVSENRRKTPAVLNKPQYARFLQCDLEAKSRQLLRSRSNEFQNSNKHNNYNNNQLGALVLPTAATTTHQHQTVQQQQPQQQPLPQKRSASFSFGSAPLGFYTPVKAPIDNLFQLGVTRAPNGNGHAYNSTTANGNGNTGSHNGTGGSSGGGGGGVCSFVGGSIVGIGAGLNGLSDEPESLQYIKPANDDLTIAYSEGAQKTDLLY